jgi:hypothetical protein
MQKIGTKRRRGKEEKRREEEIPVELMRIAERRSVITCSNAMIPVVFVMRFVSASRTLNFESVSVILLPSHSTCSALYFSFSDFDL